MKRGVHKGQDSRTPKPDSALKINPSGPGMSIMLCRFSLASVSRLQRSSPVLFTPHFGNEGMSNGTSEENDDGSNKNGKVRKAS